MDTARVVCHGGDALRRQRGLDLVAVFKAQSVLRVHVQIVRGDIRCDAGIHQIIAVAVGHFIAFLDLFLKNLHLSQQNGGLDAVQTRVHAQHQVFIPFGAAVIAQHDELFVQRLVIGKERAAFAVAAQGLGRIETGAADQGGSAAVELFAVGCALFSAKALSRVLDHGQTMFGGDGVDLFHVRHLTVKADRDDRLGAGCDRLFNEILIDVERIRTDVHKNRFCPHDGNDFRRSKEGIGDCDHFISGPDTQRAQSHFQRNRSGSRGNTKTCPRVSCQFVFQFRDLRPQNVLTMVENIFDPFLNRLADKLILRLKIDKLHDFFSGTRPAGNNLKGIYEKNNLNSCHAFCFAEMGLVCFFLRQCDAIVTFKKSLTHFEFLRMIILFYSHKMIFFNNLLEIPKKRFPSKNIEVID